MSTPDEPRLKLTSDETLDQAMELFFDAKFTELLTFDREYCAPEYLVECANAVQNALMHAGIPEKLFERYVNFLYETCDNLTIIRNGYVVRRCESDQGIIVQILIARKHLTEGGRLAETASALNSGRALSFNAEELKLLWCVGYTLLLEDYNDEEEHFEEPEGEDEDDDDEEGDPEKDVCECAECIIKRYEGKQPPSDNVDSTFDVDSKPRHKKGYH